MTEMREPDRDIGLCPADMQRQRRRLHQQFVARRGQSDQQFAEKDEAVLGHPNSVRPELVEGPFFSLTSKDRTVLRQAQHERPWVLLIAPASRSEEHTSELQSLMRNSYAVFC